MRQELKHCNLLTLWLNDPVPGVHPKGPRAKIWKPVCIRHLVTVKARKQSKWPSVGGPFVGAG